MKYHSDYFNSLSWSCYVLFHDFIHEQIMVKGKIQIKITFAIFFALSIRGQQGYLPLVLAKLRSSLRFPIALPFSWRCCMLSVHASLLIACLLLSYTRGRHIVLYIGARYFLFKHIHVDFSFQSIDLGAIYLL